MTREEAYKLLTVYLKNPNLIKHSLAAEAAMKGIYLYLNPQSPDPLTLEKWGITGLLHDADYEMSKGQPEKHGLMLFETTTVKIPEDIAHAIKAHNFAYTKVMPQSPMDWTIAACDQLTGLIVAAALVHPARNASLPASQEQRGSPGASVAGGPDKKLASLTPEFVLNRMNSNSFARGADRKSILLCEEKLQIKLIDFIGIVLSAMQGISTELGL